MLTGFRAAIVGVLVLFAGFAASDARAQDRAASPYERFIKSMSTLPMQGARSREVASLVVYDGGAGATYGEVAPIVVRVDDSDRTVFRVGIYETEVSGTGDMWRAAAWMSTAAAAQLTGFTPASRHTAFEINGRIDGPSAGGIMTVGILAAVQGDPIRPEVAMTGMINPDFSLGPVGGIPHKVEAAAKQGKKVVIIPGVSRFDYDKNLERDVDLIDLGKRLGIEVKPVFDVYTAYEIMTGKELPRLPFAEEPEMSEDENKPYIVRSKEWLNRYQLAKKQYESADEDAKSEYMADMMAYADESAERCVKLTREGAIIPAYRCAFESVVYAVDAAEAVRIGEIWKENDIEHVRNDVKNFSGAWQKVDLAVMKLKGRLPRTLDAAVYYMDAYANLTEAITYCVLADELLAKEGQEDEKAIEDVMQAGIFYQYAMIDLMGLDELIEDMNLPDNNPAPAAERVALAASLYRRAADANLAMFESLHIQPKAESEGVAMAVVRQRLMTEDWQYNHLRRGLVVLKVLEKLLGKGPELDYAVLSTMGQSYIASTMLISKYYSLQVKLEDGYISEVGREAALRAMLDFAQDQARRSIKFLTSNGKSGANPTSAYLVARIKREGDLEEKVDALSFYWNAHHAAQVLAFLSGLTGSVEDAKTDQSFDAGAPASAPGIGR